MPKNTSSHESDFSSYAGLPLPQPSWDNHQFWDYCRQHQLRIQRCLTCYTHRYYPRPVCPDCQSSLFEWDQLTGKGEIYSYTIAYPPTLKYFQDKVPLPIGVIKLDEGNVFMIGRLVEMGLDEVKIGAPVQVTFEDVSEDISLPQWKPLEY